MISLEKSGYSKNRINEILLNFEKTKKEITIYEAEEKVIKSNN